MHCALHFVQIEALWQLFVEQVYEHHFPTAFAHFMSLCHILVILTIFQMFFIIIAFAMVICEQ